MSDKTKKSIRQLYGIALSVMLIITGILLMVACVRIYKIGNRPFTPENISAEFSKISIFVWCTVIATVAGIALAVALPLKDERLRATTDKKITLSRMLGKVNTDMVRKDLSDKNDKEKKLCSLLRIGAIILCIAASLPAVIYSFNMGNFGSDYNDSVISACIRILPSAFVIMGVSIAYIILENRSLDRRIRFAKEMLADSRGQFSDAKANETRKNGKITLSIRISIAVVALLFIVLGTLNGGMADVLSKAINICTECIGLG